MIRGRKSFCGLFFYLCSMKTTNLLLLGAGGVLLYMFLRRKATAAQNLRFEPVDIIIDLPRTRQSFFTRLYYTLKINVINSEQANVNVRNVVLRVNSNGRALGDLVSNKTFSIPARSNQVIGLDAAVSVFGALSTIINFVKNRQPIPVNVTGQITSDLGILDVNYNTTVL
jgi:hypothetical protein